MPDLSNSTETAEDFTSQFFETSTSTTTSKTFPELNLKKVN